jgi:DNA polymerase-3 subunit epsilon
MDSLKFTHRLIVLDTETTGLSYQDGHRIIEIGAIELLNRRFTGKRFHAYINPERFIDEGALAVHGISNEFLADKALFKEISGDFIDFIEGAELIIHNAPFDVGFINYEFSLLENFNKTIADYCTVFDTLKFAKQKHQGQRNSLDALCKRYGVDNSQRELHGALLDAEILADVFLLMTGGQFSLLEQTTQDNKTRPTTVAQPLFNGQRKPLKIIYCSEEERVQHEKCLAAIEKTAGTCLWNATTP